VVKPEICVAEVDKIFVSRRGKRDSKTQYKLYIDSKSVFILLCPLIARAISPFCRIGVEEEKSHREQGIHVFR